MIKKLQRKFVFIATLSLLIVMIVVLGTINTINILQMNKQASEVLELLAANDGRFPDLPNSQKEPSMTLKQEGDSHENAPSMPKEHGSNTGSSSHNSRNTPGKPMPDHMSPETPFETRYFIVRVSKDLQITDVDTSHIAAITATEAEEYAFAAMISGKTTGFSKGYKFLIAENESGYVLVFIDCHSKIQTVVSFLIISIMIAVVSVFVVFVLIWFFSKRAIRPVAESIEKQKQFITDAGHELKTPISIISANTDVLELLSGQNQWTESIHHQTTRLSNLVKDLLTLSKMDEDSYQPEWSVFSISDVVTEVYNSFALVAQSANKAFTASIAQGLSLNGDPSQIQKLLNILCDNAVKYTPEKGEISLTLEPRGKGILLCIKNTSSVIPEGDLHRLFDRFYRGEASRSRETGGYGIGLSIAQAIVLSHKGKISACREGDHTMVFTVLL